MALSPGADDHSCCSRADRVAADRAGDAGRIQVLGVFLVAGCRPATGFCRTDRRHRPERGDVAMRFDPCRQL